MKAHDLAYWIGTFGKTYYKQGANWVQGKTLSVQDASTVTYGGDAMTGITYSKSELSWTGGGSGTSGTIDFGPPWRSVAEVKFTYSSLSARGRRAGRQAHYRSSSRGVRARKCVARLPTDLARICLGHRCPAC